MSELASPSAADGRSHPVVSANQAPAEQSAVLQCKDHASSSASQSHVPSDGSPSEDDISLDNRIRSALSNGDFPMRIPVNGCPTCAADSDDDSDSWGEAPSVMGYMPLPQDPDADVDSSCGCVGVGISDGDTVSSPGDQPQEEGCVVSTQGATAEVKVATALKKDEVDSIKKAMCGFSLPMSAMPEWAKQVPEDVWKTELIDGLHGKKKRT